MLTDGVDTLSLDASGLRAAVVAFRDVLRTCREVLNRLNVYPVPDGDTGTNMVGTVESVVAELDDAGPSMAEVCHAIAHGSLMGARGNSGIILCQVLRGLSEVVGKADQVGPAALAEGLSVASRQADGAVARPVEGTILTVVRASAGAARTSAAAGDSLHALLDAARDAAVEALAGTPDQLPVLAKAGVVDAGGAGYCLLLDALLHVVDDRPLPKDPPIPDAALQAVSGGRSVHDSLDAAAAQAHAEHGPDGDVSELRYEVMYLLEAPEDAVAGFRQAWSSIGDSIVVVGGDGLWNCHIHTDDIGSAVEAALDAGRPRNIRVTDLLDQVDEERWVGEATEAVAGVAGETVTDADADADAGSGSGSGYEEPLGPVPCAVVAVASGPGIRRLFRSLRVHRVVSGGQAMNPSTAELLAAVDAVPADQVIVLPNNKNIVPVAEQVAEMSDKTVRVVATRGVAEAFAALLDYDPDASADDNAEAMTTSAARTTSGEVTKAVRASDSEAGAIAEGDWLGLSSDGIEVVDADLVPCVTGLLSKLLTDEHEIVTLVVGEGAAAADTRSITAWLNERGGVEVDVHDGGQPHYPYLLSLE